MGRCDNLRQQVNNNDWTLVNTSQFQIITLPGKAHLKDRTQCRSSHVRIDEEPAPLCELTDTPSLVTSPSTASTISSCVTPKSDCKIISRGGTRSRLGPLSNSLAELQQATQSNECDTETDDSSAVPSSEAGSDTISSSDNVIFFLHTLPAGLQLLLYGLIQHGEAGQSSNSQTLAASPGESSTSRSTLSKKLEIPNKRKQEDGDEDPPDEERRRGSRARIFSQSKVRGRKFACPFYIKDPQRYCVRNEEGGTGDHYVSCMGTGWKELRHLSEHLKNVHRPQQCPNCWDIADSQAELYIHTSKKECTNRSDFIERKEGIDDGTWPNVKTALSTPRSSQTNPQPMKSDSEKWMSMWEFLFPELPKPVDPYYPDTFNLARRPVPCDGFEEILAMADRLWDEKRRVSNQDPTKEQYVSMLREAHRVTTAVGTTLTTKDEPWTMDFAQAHRDRPSKPNSDILPFLSSSYEPKDQKYSTGQEFIGNELYLGQDEDTASFHLSHAMNEVGDETVSDYFNGFEYDQDAH